MDSKNKLKEDVGAALEALTKKINSIKEQVDKLCESTECFDSLSKKCPPKKDSKN